MRTYSSHHEYVRGLLLLFVVVPQSVRVSFRSGSGGSLSPPQLS